MTKIRYISGKALYLHSKITHGGLAHLARALDWQSKGDRFESDILHHSFTHKKEDTNY